MAFKVEIKTEALADLDRYLQYLIFVKENEQAARNVFNDYEETVKSLSSVAGSLKYCENPRLKEKGYRRINFLSHDYFMLYRIEENTAVVDKIFHSLQDYENKMI